MHNVKRLSGTVNINEFSLIHARHTDWMWLFTLVCLGSGRNRIYHHPQKILHRCCASNVNEYARFISIGYIKKVNTEFSILRLSRITHGERERANIVRRTMMMLTLAHSMLCIIQSHLYIGAHISNKSIMYVILVRSRHIRWTQQHHHNRQMLASIFLRVKDTHTNRYKSAVNMKNRCFRRKLIFSCILLNKKNAQNFCKDPNRHHQQRSVSLFRLEKYNFALEVTRKESERERKKNGKKNRQKYTAKIGNRSRWTHRTRKKFCQNANCVYAACSWNRPHLMTPKNRQTVFAIFSPSKIHSTKRTYIHTQANMHAHNL